MKNDEVKRIAKLARIELTDTEAKDLGARFDDILNYIHKMDELDLSEVEPMSHPFDLVNVFREDEPHAALGPDALMKISPKSQRGMYWVPKIIEGKE